MRTTTIRRRNTIVALVLAAFATVLTLYVASAKSRGKADAAVPAAAQLRTVYVARRDIPAGTPAASLLAGKALERRALPVAGVAPGAVAAPAQLGGLVTAQPIYAGEQVTMRRFTPARAIGILAKIRGAARAVQVAGDANQLLAGTIKDGDRVDLLASLHVGQSQSALTKIVLRNLLVLQAPSSSSSTGSTSYSVVLQASDLQVQKLFYVVKNADWTLILRPVLKPYDDSDATASATSVLGSSR